MAEWRCAEFLHILSFDARLKRVVSFTHGPLCSTERVSGTHYVVGVVGCTVGLDTLRFPGIKSGFPSYPPEVDILTSSSKLAAFKVLPTVILIASVFFNLHKENWKGYVVKHNPVN